MVATTLTGSRNCLLSPNPAAGWSGQTGKAHIIIVTSAGGAAAGAAKAAVVDPHLIKVVSSRQICIARCVPYGDVQQVHFVVWQQQVRVQDPLHHHL